MNVLGPLARRTFAFAFAFALLGCGRGIRPASEEDRRQAEAACAAQKRPYSAELSKGMADDLEARCASGGPSCERFRRSIARVCSYKHPRATILMSDAVEVYTRLGASDGSPWTSSAERCVR